MVLLSKPREDDDLVITYSSGLGQPSIRVGFLADGSVYGVGLKDMICRDVLTITDSKSVLKLPSNGELISVIVTDTNGISELLRSYKLDGNDYKTVDFFTPDYDGFTAEITYQTAF